MPRKKTADEMIAEFGGDPGIQMSTGVPSRIRVIDPTPKIRASQNWRPAEPPFRAAHADKTKAKVPVVSIDTMVRENRGKGKLM